MFKGAVVMLKDIIFGLLDGIGDFLKEQFPQYAEQIGTVINFIKAMFETLKDMLMKVIDLVVEFGKTTVDFIMHPIEKAKQLVSDFMALWHGGFEGIGDWVNQLFKHSIDKDIGRSLGRAEPIISKFGDMFESAFDNVSKAVGSVLGKLTGEGDTKNAPPPIPAKGSLATESLMGVVAATHNPMWYRNDFRPMFQQAVKQIVAALQETPALAGVPGGGGRGMARPVRRPSAQPDEVGLGQRVATATNGNPVTGR
jgi:hypothetical protein